MENNEVNKIILQEIQNEIKEEDNLDFSLDELFEIANSQFVGGAVAVNKRISFIIPYLGTFVLKNKRFMIQSVIHTGRLKDKLPKEQYDKIVQAKRIANKKTNHPSTLPLIKNLSALPEDLANSSSIASINKLYREIIEEHIENPEIEINLKKHKIEHKMMQNTYDDSFIDELKDELLNEDN